MLSRSNRVEEAEAIIDKKVFFIRENVTNMNGMGTIIMVYAFCFSLSGFDGIGEISNGV